MTLLFICLLVVGLLLACVLAIALFFGALFLLLDYIIDRAQRRNTFGSGQ